MKLPSATPEQISIPFPAEGLAAEGPSGSRDPTLRYFYVHVELIAKASYELLGDVEYRVSAPCAGNTHHTHRLVDAVESICTKF